MAASSPMRAESTASVSIRRRAGSCFTTSGGARCTSMLRKDVYHPAPPSLRQGTYWRSSKCGSSPRSCLQRDGTKRTPMGDSWATDMPRRRPKKRIHRSGCLVTLSACSACGAKYPGSGLSCRKPPREGSRRPSCGSANSPPACARKARVTPPPPSPSSASSALYFTRSLPGRRSSGASLSTGPKAEVRSWLRSTVMSTRPLVRRGPLPRKANKSTSPLVFIKCSMRLSMCSIMGARRRQRPSSSRSCWIL
mmetsp:Transcript_38635/g.82155  ORF Transcript_38635/g.82155 Transcript_38635/m.82155 type:complete len:251 (+) Transcript_38635:1297-2049(+)